MSSLLLFARSSNSKLQGIQQTNQPERGDVIDMRDDDLFDWGRAIYTMGWWQVIIVPNASHQDLNGLLTSSSAGRQTDTTSWRHRIWTVDLDVLSVNQIAGGVWSVPLERFMTAIKRKPQVIEATQTGSNIIMIG